MAAGPNLEEADQLGEPVPFESAPAESGLFGLDRRLGVNARLLGQVSLYGKFPVGRLPCLKS